MLSRINLRTHALIIVNEPAFLVWLEYNSVNFLNMCFASSCAFFQFLSCKLYIPIDSLTGTVFVELSELNWIMKFLKLILS